MTITMRFVFLELLFSLFLNNYTYHITVKKGFPPPLPRRCNASVFGAHNCQDQVRHLTKRIHTADAQTTA